MKRSTVLFSCLAVAGGIWLAHVVWAQTADTGEKTVTITKSRFDKLVADEVAKAVAAEREKAAADKSTGDKVVTDDQVLKAENWHRAVFDKMEFVVYTGPGQALMHHWTEAPPMPKGGVAPRSGTAPKSGTGTAPKSGAGAAPKSGTGTAPAPNAD